MGDVVGIVRVLVVQGGAYVGAGLLVLILLPSEATVDKPSAE